MTTQQIKEQLCYADERNPNKWKYDYSITNIECYCSNCTTGKHDLANELLRVKEINIKQLKAIEETRLWYINEGFNLLAPETPIVFSNLLDFILPMNNDKEKFI